GVFNTVWVVRLARPYLGAVFERIAIARFDLLAPRRRHKIEETDGTSKFFRLVRTDLTSGIVGEPLRACLLELADTLEPGAIAVPRQVRFALDGKKKRRKRLFFVHWGCHWLAWGPTANRQVKV